MRADSRNPVIGIDTGGTFTDVTVLDPDSGRIWIEKTFATPDDPSRGFAEAVRRATAVSAVSPGEVGRVLHATTVATNLILEKKGPSVAVLVTEGFKYVLEIARQDVPRGSNLLAWVKPARPVPPQRIWEIAGRLDHEGVEVEPLSVAAVRAAAREIRALGIPAVAIVFLHSYASPEHEHTAAAIVTAECPDVLVSTSAEVMPVFREYERTMTTALNSYVMPSVSGYVGRLEDRLTDERITAPLLLMKSSGGVTSVHRVRKAPVETALSGPAAGIVAAMFIGESVGERNLIGIDIGGTSADISLIENGRLELTVGGRVGDWPVGLPMVDLNTIGAGGGSIARVTATGSLTVGPESAGATPGPVCYGRGGTEPTVTDAHLVLGHVPDQLLGGALELNRRSARAAIETTVARPLGLSVEQAARGILDIANNNMAGAIRVLSVERGHDPREFVLLPFGGAGPLHGGAIARIMGIRTIVVPPSPGVLSALGLLVSDLTAEFSRTCVQRHGRYNLDQLSQVYRELEREAVAWLAHERVPDEMRRLRRVASLRYEHQGFELTVPWTGEPGEACTEEAMADTVRAFHELHRRIYTFAQEDTPVEIVTARVDAAGIYPTPKLPEVPIGGRAADALVGGVELSTASGWISAPVYDRSRLGAGAEISGPAVVTQLDSTTLLLPGQTGRVHRLGSLIVTDEG